ncbi:hypothetical protein EG68_05652 [Paragonimus skrjabini miyazakii]|uniref:snRNA-activating protein complex subunit 4 n=1 Tax=Paragonimus skrjabini miyazakii TaxID=59628 RepID=A0A8S9YBL5_9TREM|nr:hypothetical protein EG68_05652 [Paragonimus skrjabini miyazakii]
MDELNDNVAEVNKCIITNKTVQHLLLDILKSVRGEVAYLAHQKNELTSSCEFSGLPEYTLHRPFLRLRSGECPPLNDDALARYQRKEYNLGELRAHVIKRYLKPELRALIAKVAQCALERRIETLETKRESLLSKLLMAQRPPKMDDHEDEKISTNAANHSDILSVLKETENKLLELRGMPSSPSKWLTSALASISVNVKRRTVSRNSDDRKHLWQKRVFKRYCGPKFIREYSVQAWLNILSDAQKLLTGLDWAEISNHTFNGSVTDVNLRLVWLHRLHPGCNLADWTAIEDQKLIELVGHIGQRGKWEEIASRLDSGRTAFACFQRWQSTLNPDFILNRPWSITEDAILMNILAKLLELYPPSLIDWEAVAAGHTTRTAVECMQRARVICPSFAQLSVDERPTNPKTSSLVSVMEATAPCRPFSPSEDLQLLMGVQRHGIAGGRHGRGTGVGVGSWALIATALPGRSVKTCQRRYMNLCEQFQPWTYLEDRKLYRLRLEGEKIGTFFDLRPFYRLSTYHRLLPHFPGRSVQSLRQRFILLVRWARVWTALRDVVSSQSTSSSHLLTMRSPLLGVDNSSQQLTTGEIVVPSPEPLTDLRQLLLCSPFASQFISQLRSSGVSDPEAEAYRLLTTWTVDPSSAHSSGSHQSDTEFAQLLDDLASGLLVPRPLSTRMSARRITALYKQPAKKDSLKSSDTINETSAQLSLTEARKLVSYTQLKQVLAGPVRRCLFLLIYQTDARFGRRQRFLLDKCADDPRLQELMDDLGTERHLSIPHSFDRVDITTKLLNNDQLFWLALDEALNNPATQDVLKQSDKLAYFRVVAPFIARLMTRKVYVRNRNPKYLLDSVQLNAASPSTEPNAALSAEPASSDSSHVEASTTSHLEKANLTIPAISCPPKMVAAGRLRHKLTVLRRAKLLQIKRLLHMYGRYRRFASDVYALDPVGWTGKRQAAMVAQQLSGSTCSVPLLLRFLPEEYTKEIFQKPELIRSHCALAARACIKHALKLTDSTSHEPSSSNLLELSRLTSPPQRTRKRKRHRSCRRTQEQQPSSSEPHYSDTYISDPRPVAQVLPPCYATLLAFKSLILHLQFLVRKAGPHMSHFMEARELLRAFPGGDQCEDSLDSTAPPLRKPSLNLIRTIISPAYCRFMSIGLGLLLWPALLSNIPAQSFLEAGKRHWQDVYADIPEPDPSPLPTEPPLKMPRLEFASDSESEALNNSMLNPPDSPPNPPRSSRTRKRKRGNRLSALRRQFFRWHHVKRRAVRFRRNQLASAARVRFRMSHRGPVDQLVLGLPADVKVLYASGFRPVSIFRPKMTIAGTPTSEERSLPVSPRC